MAMNWPKLSCYSTASEAEQVCPEGWKVLQISSLFEQLKVGKRFDKKTATSSSGVPVIDQSSEGCIGYHREAPGIDASHDGPVVTFANHTCEMRLMREPFSVIQNVFPLVPTSECASPFALYYLTKGRVKLEEYKGHFPAFRASYICVPTKTEQHEIAAILGTLDDKIELNRRMAATLEEMARALYRSWFVDFDPVKAKAEGLAPAFMDEATAALFPDRFGEDGLPEGWLTGKISDLGRVVTGKTPSTQQTDNYGDFCPFVKIPDMHGRMFVTKPNSWLSEQGVRSQKMQLLAPGSVSVSCIATPGLVTINPEKAMTNQQINSVEPSNGFSTEFVFWTCVQAAQNVLLGGSGGSVFHNTNKSTFSAIPVLLGSESVRRAFTDEVITWHSLILQLDQENQTLASLRDTLLPKLMSGELRVGAARDQIEEVA